MAARMHKNKYGSNFHHCLAIKDLKAKQDDVDKKSI